MTHPRGNPVIEQTVRPLPAQHPVESADLIPELLEKVFENTSEGLLVTDARGCIVRVNAAALAVFGLSRSDVVQKRLWDFIPAENPDFAGARTPLLQAYAQRITLWRHPNGEDKPLEATCTVLHDSAGTVMGAACSVRDSTERMCAQAATGEPRDFLDRIFEGSIDCIVIKDAKGRITRASRSFLSLLGYEEHEVLGKSMGAFTPSPGAAYACTTGAPVVIGQHNLVTLAEKIFYLNKQRSLTNLNTFCIRKDGTVVPVEENVFALLDDRHQRTGAVAILRDSTERARAEDALRESERRFKELADSLPQTVFEIDHALQVTFVNRMALDVFGYGPSDIHSGLCVLSLFVPEQRLAVRENLRRVAEGARFGEHECRALRKDGTTFPCLVHATPTSGAADAPGLRGLLIDISERKNLENELLRARRLESMAALAGGVAQDFSSLLSVILGNINLAQHHAPPAESMAVPLSCAEKSALRAKDLTDQLLLFARRGEAVKKPLCMASLLRQAIDRALPPGSGVCCSFEPADPPWTVAVDEAQMLQVFVSLLINAEHAMPEGGTIHMGLHNISIGPGDNLPLPGGHYLKITLRDQSIGILNEHIQNIFDPYFSRRPRGSGIGLATTYTIVKNHGGLVVVESEFGRGTTFRVYLPAAGGVAE